MNKIEDLIKRLIDVILVAYKESEFRDLLYVKLSELQHADFDYAGLSSALSFRERVTETVNWANRFGEPKLVLWLARGCSDGRHMRTDLKQLVKDLESIIEPPAPVAQSAVPGAPPSLPPDLSATLTLFDPTHATSQQLVPLRKKLRNGDYDGLNLPGRFHLSESDAERLAAVLALESDPNPDYLRWLSERVTVELPLVGLVAAQALTSAARCLDRTVLPRVRAAVQSAEDRLLELREEESAEPASYGLRQRLDQTNAALKIVNIRTRRLGSNLSPDDFDVFLATLIEAFLDHAGFTDFCATRLKLDVAWVGVRPDDPLEYGVINVVVSARERGKEKELIRAAYQEHKNIQALADLHARYAVAAAG